jgi:hypothetical protein
MHDRINPMKIKDIRQKRVGNLVVIKQAENLLINGRSIVQWECRCDCGKLKIVRSTNLLNGRTGSCGSFLCQFANARRRFVSPSGDGARMQVWRMYTLDAKRKERPFTLSKDEFFALLARNCFYCDAVPANKAKRNNPSNIFIYNGIDRVDPSKGYTQDNVRTCCWNCNRMKGNTPEVVFLEHVQQICKHLRRH